MADLTYIQSTLEVKIAGQDATGNNVNFVGADSSGNMLTKDFSDGTAGSAVPTVVMQVGGKDTSGNLRPLPIDENAILAITEGSTLFNSQSKVFAAQTPVILVGTTETPFYLLRNPLASGKTLKVIRMKASGAGTFRVYYLPTVTANGTTVAPLLRKVTSGAQGNVGLATSSPTTSANGSLADILVGTAQIGTSFLEYPSYLILPANTSILITAAMAANNTSTSAEMEWIEL